MTTRVTGSNVLLAASSTSPADESGGRAPTLRATVQEPCHDAGRHSAEERTARRAARETRLLGCGERLPENGKDFLLHPCALRHGAEEQEHLLHVLGPAPDPELVILPGELEVEELRPHRLKCRHRSPRGGRLHD